MFQYDLKKLRPYGPSVVRIGLSIVFLWFGIMQILHPEIFVAWLPQEVSIIPLQLTTFVLLNGIFETVFGTMMILGIFTRLSSLLLGLHLAGITLTIGFTEIGIRDFGLTIATLSIFLTGPDKLCLEKLFPKKENRDH